MKLDLMGIIYAFFCAYVHLLLIEESLLKSRLLLMSPNTFFVIIVFCFYSLNVSYFSICFSCLPVGFFYGCGWMKGGCTRMDTSVHTCLFHLVSSESPEVGKQEYVSLDELKRAVKSMKSEKFTSLDMKVSSMHVCV